MDLVENYRAWRQRRRLGITCRAAAELATDYLEGALGERQRRRFEQHLANCASCARFLDQLRTTCATLARLEPEAIDPEVRDSLITLYRVYHSTP